jgi:hypothetical protein
MGGRLSSFGMGIERGPSILSAQFNKMERVAGVEPASLAWEARVLPMYDTRTVQRFSSESAVPSTLND